MAVAGFKPGEKGVRGVCGPLEPLVPAEVRFIMRELEVPMGDLMLDEEASEDIDCDVDRAGLGSATGFAAFSRREKRPMFPASRGMRPAVFFQRPSGGREAESASCGGQRQHDGRARDANAVGREQRRDAQRPSIKQWRGVVGAGLGAAGKVKY